MKIVRSLLLGLVGVVAIAAVVVAVRTVTFKPQIQVHVDAVKLAPSIPIDNGRAAQHLGEAIRIRTVSHQDASQDDGAEWDRLHAWLQATYPAAHAAMRRTVVAGRTLVYEWPGTDASLAPIILLAHHDVVPVDAETEKDWRHAPFAGDVADGAVWGRGAVDNKGSLVLTFEAIEALAGRGFQPRRSVYVISGHDEEVGGHGARAAAEYLKSKGVMALFTLDEGFAVLVDDATEKPAALVGIAEKGYATLQVTAPSTGGHSSMPPAETGVITLAKALVAIAAHPAPLRLDGPPAQMLDALAPSAPLKVRMAVANRWLFDPLLVRVMAATPAGAAMLHTTIAPTMLEGSPKENVLPQSARGLINYRISPGDSSDAVMERARAAVGGLPVELAWHGEKREPSVVSSTTSDGWKIVAAAAAASSHAPVAPSLVIGGTDSRWLQPVSHDVYRFQPLVMTMKETSMIHGTNEHMTLANLALMTDFYARLIATAAG